MAVNDLRKLDLGGLSEREAELREEIARLTMKRNARRLDKPSDLSKARLELARLMTVKRERQIAPAGVTNE